MLDAIIYAFNLIDLIIYHDPSDTPTPGHNHSTPSSRDSSGLGGTDQLSVTDRHN